MVQIHWQDQSYFWNLKEKAVVPVFRIVKDWHHIREINPLPVLTAL
jgi:hypothetical protein